MNSKKETRQRRSRRTRHRIRAQRAYRLTVHGTAMHMYAQLIAPDAGTTVAAASTLEKTLVEGLSHTGNVEASRRIGVAIAERAKAAGITRVAFDRSGFKYHGRVKALADAARENGLEF